MNDRRTSAHGDSTPPLGPGDNIDPALAVGSSSDGAGEPFGGEPNGLVPPSDDSPAGRWTEADDATRISKRTPLPPLSGEALRPIELGHLLEGQQLEHFLLQECVGGGGMGAVFRALDTRLNRIVAIKVLARDHADDEETVRRFRNEAQSAARLDHENIARAYYVGEDRGVHFIAFEFIEGQNIRDIVIERGPLPLAEALSFTLQIADALGHASSRDVVHRDIKPSNVLITHDGKAKLVDMGLARLQPLGHSSDDLTASGVTLGTFDYISPEQARDPRLADVRSDIYSLGCACYFMLTGQPPFPEGTVLQKLLQHQGDEPPDPRALNPAVTDEVARIVGRMMAKEPRQRYQTPADLVVDLLKAGEPFGLQPPGTTQLPLDSKVSVRGPSWERHMPWAVPVAALVLIVLGVEITSSWRSSPSRQEQALLTPETTSGPDRIAPVRPGVVKSGAARAETKRPRPSSAPEVGAPPDLSSLGQTDDQADNQESEFDSATDQALSNSGATESVGMPATPPLPATGNAIKVTRPGGVAADDALVETRNRNATTAPSAAVDTAAPRMPSDTTPLTASVAVGSAQGMGVTAAGTGLEARAEARGSDADTAVPTTQRAVPPGRPAALVVDPTGAIGGSFASLADACAAASAGDIIELHYDGPRLERPIELRNTRLTIRAAQNVRPVITFRPSETDPLKFRRSMLLVAGGQLTLEHLSIELDLPAELPADRWTLFSIKQADAIELRDCTLTIANGSGQTSQFHAGVTFFDIAAPPPSASVIVADQQLALPEVSITLTNCIARGEAVFLQLEGLQPCRLAWNNGLLAVSERLLVSRGGAEPAAIGAHVEIDLRHLTVATRDGLCLLTNTADAPHQLETWIHCDDSILLVGANNALIEQTGTSAVADFRRAVTWEGERNFYDGFRLFWRISGRGPDGAAQEMSLPTSTWLAFWKGEDRSHGHVVWQQLPDALRPMHDHTAVDYALDATAAENGALGGATDGRNVGLNAASLPRLPAGKGTTGTSAKIRATGDAFR